MEPAFVALVVVLTSAVALVLGGVISHLAYRAARRTQSRVLYRFAAGFGLVTLGLLSGGALHQLLGWTVLEGVLVQRLLTIAGFGLLVYSLYSHAERDVYRSDES
jgi:hypothetical protein